MSNSLVPIAQAPQGLAVPQQDEIDIFRLGQLLAQSGFFKEATDEAKAVVKVLAGREMGFGPIASMTGIHIIEGRPAVGANLMAMAIKRSQRYDYKVVASQNDYCELEFFEKGVRVGSVAISIQEATAAGWTRSWDYRTSQFKDKANWKAFPSDMLFARCISRGVRRYCPDVFSTPAYTEDEIDDEKTVEAGPGTTVQKLPEGRSKAGGPPPAAAAPANRRLDVFSTGDWANREIAEIPTEYLEGKLHQWQTKGSRVRPELLAAVEAELDARDQYAPQPEAEAPQAEDAPPAAVVPATPPTPPAKKDKRFLAPLWVAATSANLHTKEESRQVRLEAVNRFLADELPNPISSFNDLDPVKVNRLVYAIQDGSLSWQWPPVEAVEAEAEVDDEDAVFGDE